MHIFWNLFSPEQIACWKQFMGTLTDLRNIRKTLIDIFIYIHEELKKSFSAVHFNWLSLFNLALTDNKVWEN
jgi:hypothetical protein